MLRVRHALSGNVLLEISQQELGEIPIARLKELLEPKLGASIFRQRLLNHQNEVTSTLPADTEELQVVVVPFCQDFGEELLAAATIGHVPSLRTILEKPQHPDGGPGALHAAARYGHAEAVRLLLQAGAWQDQPGRYDATPLLEAAEHGTLQVARILVDAQSDLNQMGLGRTTPLLAACERGHLSMAQLLVERGANKECADARGVTPLLAAAGLCGSLPLVELLLDAKASCNVLDTDGKTPLRLAAGMGHADVVQCLLTTDDVDVDARDALGATPLWAAARNGRVRVTQLLLQHRAEKDARDIDGETPLLTAAETGHLQVVKTLLEARADKEAADGEGRSPLRAAAEHGRKAVVECLLEAGAGVVGASINAACLLGRSALYCATWSGHKELVETLLAARCDAMQGDGDDVLPLHLAAGKGHLPLLPLLFSSTALEKGDAKGATALWRAAQKGQLDAVQVLVLARADVNAVDKGNQTPLQIATAKCHHQVVNFLQAETEPLAKRRRLCGSSET